ncbi:MAG: DedA family protein [Alphaproteobacteria bacterium]|nr:DedA family protein [Alphaproteobacteria bacterium]
MLRQTYDRVVRLSAHPHALFYLAAVSFTESSFFPIPPDALLVPMTLAEPAKAWIYATVCTIASVVGGLFGYAIGYLLLESIGRPLLEFYGYGSGLHQFQEQFAIWGLWIILIKGMTPIPYKIVTIAAGAAQFDLFVFTLASIVTRGGRFFLEALLLRLFGEQIREFIERYLTLVTTGLLAIVVGGFLALRFI